MKKILVRLSKLNKRWGSKVLFSILDQGIFSGSNFLVTLFVGRWLSEADYGVFSIVFVIFLFLTGFYSSLLFEPMMVFGAKYSEDEFKKYLYTLIQTTLLSLVLVAALCLVLFVTNLIFPFDPVFISAIWGMILALPFVMCFWLVRQASYVVSAPQKNITAAIVYGIIYFGGVAIIEWIGSINFTSIFLTMGLASVVGVLIILKKLNYPVVDIFRDFQILRGETLDRHWQYGKWAIATFVAYGGTTLVFPPMIGVILGLEQAGVFKALQNFFLPLQQTMTALSTLLTPWASRRRHQWGDQAVISARKSFMIWFFGLAFLYLIPVNLLADGLLKFYNKPGYLDYSWSIPIFSLVMLVSAAINSYGIAFRVLEKPKQILRSKVVSVVFIFLICTLLATWWGFEGLMTGFLLSSVIELIIIVIIWKKNAKIQKGGD